MPIVTSPLRNDRLLRALRREPVDCTPVWLMRQAGRYLPEYRATRAKAGSFLAMAKNPEIACEVTLQPLRRFPLDAAILFSDILTIPDAMGLELYFVEGEGPKFRHPVRDEAAIARLAVPDMEQDLGYVMDAVRLIRRELDGQVPLIGFSGSPWTLACYMVEGGGSKDFARIKAMALNHPQALHRLLDVTTDAVIAYLGAQRAAGAQALQVFDTWGGVLSPAMYREFSLRYLQRIAEGLELGRSFVVPDYWGSRSLDYLWQGIGAYLQCQPGIRYLFGAVSISAALPREAREQLVAYYQRYYSGRSGLVESNLPFQYFAAPPSFGELDAGAAFDVLKANLAALGTGVPTLYRQYTDLCEPGGARFLAFGVDPDFSDSIDGLIEVDLQAIRPNKRKRYLRDAGMPA